jgi:hypothetical protein
MQYNGIDCDSIHTLVQNTGGIATVKEVGAAAATV